MKYSAQEFVRCALGKLYLFAASKEVSMFCALDKVVVREWRRLKMEGMAGLKGNGRRMESMGIFGEMMSYVSRSRDGEFMREAFGVLYDC